MGLDGVRHLEDRERETFENGEVWGQGELEEGALSPGRGESGGEPGEGLCRGGREDLWLSREGLNCTWQRPGGSTEVWGGQETPDRTL